MRTARRLSRCAFGREAATVLLLLGSGAVLRAAPATEVSAAQFRADVARMQSLVAACSASTVNCKPSQVAADEKVAGNPGFELHWDWLRNTLTLAAKPVPQLADGKPVDRAVLLRNAAAQLSALARDSDNGVSTTPDFNQVRSTAADVLSSAEFQRENEGPTWWDRQLAKLYRWIGKIFDGFDQLGTAAPWLGKLMEWLLFTAAAVGLLLLLLRNVRRQRLRVAEGAGGPESAAWDREANDWKLQAEEHAAAGEWREAVHCLYWAAIVLLESRRAWRHNPTRTPREYVRLLQPGSARQAALRGLTQMFERVWYGQREAGEPEFARARSLYEALAHEEEMQAEPQSSEPQSRGRGGPGGLTPEAA